MTPTLDHQALACLAAASGGRLPVGRRILLAGLPALGPREATAGPAAVTLLVGAAPGTSADTWARTFAPFLERHWPRNAVAVVNLPGDGGLAAARFLAAAPPDGRLLGAVASPLLLARAVAAGETSLLDQLRFVAAVVAEPVVLVALPAMVPDLATLRAPASFLGRHPTLGTPPPGTAAQLAAFAFGRAAAMTSPLIPLAFATAAAARQAVLAGNLTCAMLGLPEAIVALRDGRLVGLGIAEPRRSVLLPDVPTFEEQGIGLTLSAHRGFAVPAGTQPTILQPLARSLRDAVLDPEFVSQAESQGIVPHFRDLAGWEPALRQTTKSLVQQWAIDPWIARQD